MAKHFDENGNEIRCVYLAEFEADNFCYIGTTDDYESRISQHLFEDRKSEVYRHKRHTGFVPTFSLLHDYTSIEEADRLEHYYTIEYAKLGRKILNVQKPGGYGHKDNNIATPRNIKGIVNEYAKPYNAMAEYEKTTFSTYRYQHKGEYSDSVKKVYDILIALCKRVCEQGGERIYIRKSDIPYTFSYDELISYDSHSPIKSTRTPALCITSFFHCKDDDQKSYIVCSDIDNIIAEHGVLCQYENPKIFEKVCDDIYKKCYVFKRIESVRKYIHDNLKAINDEITKHLTRRNITIPFNTKIEIETLGYNDSIECRKIDYALMLGLMGGFLSPSFSFSFDRNWELSSLTLCVSYNSYSNWAKQYDLYEMQNSERQSKFGKLVEKIDNFILSNQNIINDFPKRIEILAKDLRISDIDTLKSFMRHFYVSHGTAWDTGSPDSCICSIENYNGYNMNGCKLIIDIQGKQFFHFYDLKNHILDDSNSFANNCKPCNGVK